MFAQYSALVVALATFVAGCTSGPAVSRSPAASPLQPGQQTERAFAATISREARLKYLLYLPKNYTSDPSQRFPLVLFLHGAGERGTDVQKVAVHGPPKLVAAGREFPFILVSPQCPENQVWDDEALLRLITSLQQELRVDPTRIHVTGLSMGGYGTWSLISRRPDLFASAAPICGGGDRIRTLLLTPAQREALKSLPVWVFHGAKDSVVPLSESERMIDQLKRAGSTEVQFTVYPEANHDSWTETYNSPAFFDWMLRQHR